MRPNQQSQSFDEAAACRSVVRVVKKRGEHVGFGVLVDDFIVTASHCLPRNSRFKVRLPDPDDQGASLRLARIQTLDGKRSAQAVVAAVDPCSDLAALSHTTFSGAENIDHYADFVALQGALTPAQVFIEPKVVAPLDQPWTPPAPRPVWLLNLDEVWVRATMDGSSLRLKDAAGRVEAGMSGGPVFDAEGRVLGVVSTAHARVSLLWRGLPGWVLDRLCEWRPRVRGAPVG